MVLRVGLHVPETNFEKLGPMYTCDTQRAFFSTMFVIIGYFHTVCDCALPLLYNGQCMFNSLEGVGHSNSRTGVLSFGRACA